MERPLEENKKNNTFETKNFRNEKEFLTQRAKSEVERTEDRQYPEEIKKLQEKIHELEQEKLNLEETNLGLTAEISNIKKRTNREIGNMAVYANSELLAKLLPLLDDLERSLNYGDAIRQPEDFMSGVELVYQNFRKALEQTGLKPIEAVGKQFDYNFHEAVLQVEKSDAQPGTVVEEVQKGYIYKEKVLRHSKVFVSK